MDIHSQKILVTGSTGFLGAQVVAKLIERGVSRDNIIASTSKKNDLRERKNCEEITKAVDYVIHAAGVTGNAEFHKKHPAEIFHDNLVMGVELMQAARMNGVKKFITIGSATEYPESAPMPLQEKDLWIGDV